MENIEKNVDVLSLRQELECLQSEVVKSYDGIVVLDELVMGPTLPWETHLVSKRRIDKHRQDLDCNDLKIVLILHEANS